MKYGLIQHWQYLLNYDKTVAHLQADLSHVPIPKDITPLKVRPILIEDQKDLLDWLEIVNDAYEVEHHNMQYANDHFNNHRFLDITQGYFVLDGEKPIATISMGTYKSNTAVGGDARIAVKKRYQGCGLGSFLVQYGFHMLRNEGVKYGESIITITRMQSLLLHFKSGFIPQTNRKYIQYIEQNRSIIIRLVVNSTLRKVYRRYLKSQSQKFESSR